MIMPAIVLVVSGGLFFFYLQAFCEKILQRGFTKEYFQSIVNANYLEFPSVRRAVEDFGEPIEYSRLKVTLNRDFLILTYLLKNAVNINQRCTAEERLFMLYFRVLFLSFVAQHWLRWGENLAVLKLTAILEYFANVVGQRVNRVRFGDLTAAEDSNPQRPGWFGTELKS